MSWSELFLARSTVSVVWVLVCDDGGFTVVLNILGSLVSGGLWVMGCRILRCFVSWMMDLNCGKLRLLWVFWW